MAYQYSSVVTTTLAVSRIHKVVKVGAQGEGTQSVQQLLARYGTIFIILLTKSNYVLHAVLLDKLSQLCFKLWLPDPVTSHDNSKNSSTSFYGLSECLEEEGLGRISIEAMAFKLPILGTAASGTTEIVVDESTGLLHQVGKEGVLDLASNTIKLFRDPNLTEAGYKRVQERATHVRENSCSSSDRLFLSIRATDIGQQLSGLMTDAWLDIIIIKITFKVLLLNSIESYERNYN
ncbi:hypothetical protein SELMODRAFT_419653 [Selaginella moellendorffii]|uniref:Glycosyl transferase family 1 domain-containing protein n=1 Tax=Selaginella moellendorffii TaxID=88036 RepID=D8S9L6_SELML|nr:hypothetical protein SELMODRAFT_419653 [Selaginella moellendorffii]